MNTEHVEEHYLQKPQNKNHMVIQHYTAHV